MMICVIIVAGIAVDWWDARQSHMASKPALEVVSGDATVKRLVDENERLKTDIALLNMQNDSLRKQIDELNQKPVEPPKVEVVKGDKPGED